jgi:GNAT superfamily N-acetyltransferase
LPAISISEADVSRVAELEPLWRAMHAHHATMQDEVAPVRAFADSWQRRRAQYEGWLGNGEAVLLIAESESRPVGYAVVRPLEAPATWEIGERGAELESLAVLSDARRGGVGRMLIAAVRDVARRWGAAHLSVGVAHANHDAIRFYEREGFEPFYVLMLDAPPA